MHSTINKGGNNMCRFRQQASSSSSSSLSKINTNLRTIILVLGILIRETRCFTSCTAPSLSLNSFTGMCHFIISLLSFSLIIQPLNAWQCRILLIPINLFIHFLSLLQICHTRYDIESLIPSI